MNVNEIMKQDKLLSLDKENLTGSITKRILKIQSQIERAESHLEDMNNHKNSTLKYKENDLQFFLDNERKCSSTTKSTQLSEQEPRIVMNCQSDLVIEEMKVTHELQTKQINLLQQQIKEYKQVISKLKQKINQIKIDKVEEISNIEILHQKQLSEMQNKYSHESDRIIQIQNQNIKREYKEETKIYKQHIIRLEKQNQDLLQMLQKTCNLSIQRNSP